MKFKFLKAAFAGLVFTVSSSVYAELMIDTANDSFIDTTTGLEWMDFGVNTSYSSYEVASLLTTTFSGWSLATEVQVVEMWGNAFEDIATATNGNFDKIQLLWYIANTDQAQNDFDAVFDIMGARWDSNVEVSFYDTGGDFAGYVEVKNGGGAKVNTGNHDYGNNTIAYYGTMLVREGAVDVPEPAAFAIFALGMIGLATRRFKKQS